MAILALRFLTLHQRNNRVVEQCINDKAEGVSTLGFIFFIIIRGYAFCFHLILM